MKSIKLDDTEIFAAQQAGTNRAISNVANKTKENKQSNLNSYVLNLDGAVSEYAFCKLYNCCMDLSFFPRSGGYDCMYRGYRIDVKSTRHLQGGLMTPKNTVNKSIDIYVLSIFQFTDNIVNFIGWAFFYELILQENITLKGQTNSYYLESSKLRSMEDLDTLNYKN